jgi:hypothetical protein
MGFVNEGFIRNTGGVMVNDKGHSPAVTLMGRAGAIDQICLITQREVDAGGSTILNISV